MPLPFNNATQRERKKHVHVLTTMPTTAACSAITRSVKERGKWTQKEVQRPSVIELYNQYMGNVDLAYQRVWYRKLFFYLLEIAIMDAFLLEQKSPHNNPPVTTKSPRMLVFRR